MLAAPVFFLVAAYFASILTQRSASMGLLVFRLSYWFCGSKRFLDDAEGEQALMRPCT